MLARSRFSPFSALCGAVLALSALLPSPQNGAILGLPTLCPFRYFTGLPCPGCGLTRSFVCCAHGQIAAAFAYHPLGPILFVAALLVFGAALLGRSAPRFPNRALVSFALIGAACWVLRLGGFFPFPTS